MPVMKRFRMLLRHAWASPCTLAALPLALACILSGASVRLASGVLEVAGGRTASWVSRLPRSLRFSVITFGHVILADTDVALESHREHERVHVRQYERWGILFIPLYGGSCLIQLLRGLDPYTDNHFERQACNAVKHKTG